MESGSRFPAVLLEDIENLFSLGRENGMINRSQADNGALQGELDLIWPVKHLLQGFDKGKCEGKVASEQVVEMQVELLLVDCSDQDGQGERGQIFQAGDRVFPIFSLHELGHLLGLLSQLFYQKNGMFDETFGLALWSHLCNLSILTLNLFNLLTDLL